MQKEQYPKRSYKGILQKTFWTGFCLVIGMSVVAIIRTVNMDNRLQSIQTVVESQKKALEKMPQEDKKPEENSVAVNEEGAKIFACNFAKEFYTWNYKKDKAEERAQRLKEYLAGGLDATAGYDITRLDTASKADECKVWQFEVSGDVVDLVVKVNYTLTKKVKEKKKTSEQAVKEERYLHLSLVTDGSNFKLRSLPYLIPAPPVMEYALKADQPDASTMVTDETSSKEIYSFLETFFKFMATGTTEELRYYTKSEVESLKGIYEFIRLDNVAIYQEKEGYQVFTDVWMQDVSTKAEILMQTSVTLVREQDRYVVSEINYGNGGIK